MKELNKPEFSNYYIAHNGTGGIRHTGKVNSNQIVSTGQPNLIVDDDVNSFLKKSEDEGVSDFNPLPEYDADNRVRLQKGEIYSHQGKLLIVRQSHDRTEHDPFTVPALFSAYRENPDSQDWIANESVIAGDVRIHGGTSYKAIQDHTTQTGWEPPNVPALWKEIVEVDDNTSEWLPRISVTAGEEYTYNGVTYVVLQSHTTQTGWEPPNVPALFSIK
jgi:hypothetical protein